MPASPFAFQRLTSPEGPGFEGFWGSYEEAIPARERKSRAQVEALVCREEARLLVLQAGTEVLGFSLLHLPRRGRSFFLLEYMAVLAGQRGCGLGSALFRRSLQEGRSALGPAACLVEVDSPREAAPDQALRQRRMAFYRREGCRRVEGLDYRLPLPGPGTPPAMDLLVHLPDPSTPVSRADLRTWLETLYVEVYECDPGDARLPAMLEGLGDPVPLL